MDEGDPPPPRAGAGLFVNQAVPGSATGRQRRFKVRDAVTNMVDAGPAGSQKPGNRAIGGQGFQQFDLRTAHMEGNDPGAVRRLLRAGNHFQHIAIECQSGVDALNRDADVGNDRVIRHRRVAIQD